MLVVVDFFPVINVETKLIKSLGTFKRKVLTSIPIKTSSQVEVNFCLKRRVNSIGFHLLAIEEQMGRNQRLVIYSCFCYCWVSRVQRSTSHLASKSMQIINQPHTIPHVIRDFNERTNNVHIYYIL